MIPTTSEPLDTPGSRALALLDLTLPTPQENLALDEMLLRRCEAEAGPAGQALRFWESPSVFVCLGVAGRLHREVDVEACARDGVSFIRRVSGGGTVLQGPGCLNYTLVLSAEVYPEIRDIPGSFAFILQRVLEGLGLAGSSVRGTSDLAMGNLKFSGNAQKRTRKAVLHHGTVLHGFDISAISRWIRLPEKEPAYRGKRLHEDFVANVELSAPEIKSRIARAWSAWPIEESWRVPDLSSLVAEKYGNEAWNRRF